MSSQHRTPQNGFALVLRGSKLRKVVLRWFCAAPNSAKWFCACFAWQPISRPISGTNIRTYIITNIGLKTRSSKFSILLLKMFNNMEQTSFNPGID